MSEQPHTRSLIELALVDASDGCKCAQDLAAAILLSARGILDASDRKGMLHLACLLIDQADTWQGDIHRAQRLLGFGEGGSQ